MAPKSSPKKRVAAKSPSKRAAPKKAKVVEDHFSETLEASLALLNEDEGLTDEARTMFRVSAPFALKPAKADRHKFQENLVATLSDLLRKVEASKQEAVNQGEADVAKVQAETANNAHVVATLLAKQNDKQEAKKASDLSLKDAEEALAAAKEALGEARKTLAGLEAEHKSTIAEKAEREKLISETWAQLKDGSIPGKQWREKNKLIDKIVAILKERAVEASCTDALPVALKEKVEQRGPIALKCLEYVDAQLQKSVQDFSEKIAGHAGNVAEKAKAAEDAEAKQTGAQCVKDEKINEAIEAENALLAASEEHKTAEEQTVEIAAQATNVAGELKAVQDEHVEVKSVLARFEAISASGEAGALPAAQPDAVASDAAEPEAAEPEANAAAMEP